MAFVRPNVTIYIPKTCCESPPNFMFVSILVQKSLLHAMNIAATMEHKRLSFETFLNSFSTAPMNASIVSLSKRK